MDYGTVAVFGCPAHDERDHELAVKMNLPIKQVIESDIEVQKTAYTEYGILVNSDFLNGLTSNEAKQKVIDEFEKLDIGKRSVNYRLKDWGISRQRLLGMSYSYDSLRSLRHRSRTLQRLTHYVT